MDTYLKLIESLESEIAQIVDTNKKVVALKDQLRQLQDCYPHGSESEWVAHDDRVHDKLQEIGAAEHLATPIYEYLHQVANEAYQDVPFQHTADQGIAQFWKIIEEKVG